MQSKEEHSSRRACTTSSTPLSDRDLTLLRLLDHEVLAAPHEHYRRLREIDPVYWDPYMHAWIVTGYKEALTVLMEYSADRTPHPDYLEQLGLSDMKPFAEMMVQQMMFMDGRMHARLRSLCATAFSPRKVDELREVIERVANDLLDSVVEQGEMDLLDDFAKALPAIVTAKMLGVPVEDHEQLHIWVLDIAEVLGNFQHHPDRMTEIVGSLRDLRNYIATQVEAQRFSDNGGLIRALLTAEVDGQRLSLDEVIANTIITLIGGHETTMNLVTSGFLSLLQNPECMEQLRTQPEILGTAVEELLRFESPVQHTARIARGDVQLGGKTIRKGARVVAVLAAANRDPARFPDPDRLDLKRVDNRHLAFGWAAHFCFGAPLARMEGQIAFKALMSRVQNPRLLETSLRWRENAGLRGVISLRIGFEAARPDGTRRASAYSNQLS